MYVALEYNKIDEIFGLAGSSKSSKRVIICNLICMSTNKFFASFTIKPYQIQCHAWPKVAKTHQSNAYSCNTDSQYVAI